MVIDLIVYENPRLFRRKGGGDDDCSFKEKKNSSPTVTEKGGAASHNPWRREKGPALPGVLEKGTFVPCARLEGRGGHVANGKGSPVRGGSVISREKKRGKNL